MFLKLVFLKKEKKRVYFYYILNPLAVNGIISNEINIILLLIISFFLVK